MCPSVIRVKSSDTSVLSGTGFGSGIGNLSSVVPDGLFYNGLLGDDGFFKYHDLKDHP